MLKRQYFQWNKKQLKEEEKKERRDMKTVNEHYSPPIETSHRSWKTSSWSQQDNEG